MILCIAAMNEEYDALVDLLDNAKEETSHHVKVHRGQIDNKEVLLMLSGIGKVNATLTLTTILNDYKNIEFIINIGSAGGIKSKYNVKQLDIVVAKKVCQHDVDLTAAGDRPYGEIPGMPLYFETNLQQIMLEALASTNLTYHTATIASGDTFVATEEKANFIEEHFEDVCAVDMEAGAIAQVAYVKEIPFVVFRSISDVVGEEEDGNQLQFDKYILEASKNSALATKAVIQTFK